MQLLTFFARREPSLPRDPDPIIPRRGYAARRMDVVLYRDQAASRSVGCYRWNLSSRPTRHSRHVMHNCFRYAMQWLDDLVFESDAGLIAHRELHLRLWPAGRVVPVSDANGERALLPIL